MATTATTEASDLKRRGRQRLIGAVALVALLVVFVPMLLDSEPRPARDNGPTLAIPPKDNAPPMPAPAPAATPAKPATQAAAPAPAVAAKGADSAAPESSKTAAPQPAPVPAPPAAASAPEVAAKAPPASPKASNPPPAAATTQSGPRTGFAVQVGAFRDEAKLKQARDKLAAAKVVHYTERLDSKGGGLTRLRAGPFETREAAEAALATLRRASLDGKVVPLP
jgi:DedD protein